MVRIGGAGVRAAVRDHAGGVLRTGGAGHAGARCAYKKDYSLHSTNNSKQKYHKGQNNMLEITQDAHPLLYCKAFTGAMDGQFPQSWDEISSMLTLPGPASVPFDEPSDELKNSIRKVLRFGGFKPSGRSKPASEYLIRAASAGELSSINPIVDILNAVSLHSGIPISVVDLDLCEQPLHIAISGPDESYIFNTSGQEISLSGLICLRDAQGPCANPVKDSQRTKTHDGTKNSLTILWGSQDFKERVDKAAQWYKELLATIGIKTEDAAIKA